MSERVEVVRVGAGGRAVQIGKMTAERHSIGTYKSVEIGSWGVGIEAREYKLGRIESAAEWNRKVHAVFTQWCIDHGLTPNHGVAAVIREIAREYVRNGPKHAEILLNVIPPAYRRFWDEYKEMLISGYKSIRS